MQRHDFRNELSVKSPKHWGAGIFAIENVASGRRLYVGTRCIGKRVWDAKDRLDRGTHPNRELQGNWASDPCGFRFVLVDQLAVVPLLGLLKQARIDLDRASGFIPYNTRNSVPRASKKSVAH